jgi:hypothetical protein
MRDEHAHLIAECAQCGFRFDILLGVDCPRCRTESVKKAFAPLDALRTALAVKGVRWHGEEYYRPEPEQTEETPRGLRIPLGEAAQVYELRRMFRL